ncbi:MAG TPA: hypothetical protein VGI95_15690 [Caulobacteraceae bacterium]|jgi:hypothetical protein
MPDFEIYVEDDRYSVPTLYLITAASQAGALAMADDVWRSSDHHLSVELLQDGERLAVLGANPTTEQDFNGSAGAASAA